MKQFCGDNQKLFWFWLASEKVRRAMSEAVLITFLGSIWTGYLSLSTNISAYETIREGLWKQIITCPIICQESLWKQLIV